MKKIINSKKKRSLLSIVLIIALSIQMVAVEGLTTKAKETEIQNTVVSEEPLEILEEVESLRSEYSKSFLQSDGTYLQVTSVQPIHYKDGDTYKEIDNRLETVTKGDQTTYQNKAGDYQVSFPDDLTEPVEIQNGDHSFTMQMVPEEVTEEVMDEVSEKTPEETSEESTPSSDAERSSVDYPDLLKKHRIRNQKSKAKASKEQKQSVSEKGMDYEEILPEHKTGEIIYTNETEEVTISYQTLPNQIKESIILDSAEAAKDRYTYDIKAKGLKASKEKDGSILFYKKDKKEPIYTLEAPFMFDAGGDDSRSYEIETELVKKGSHYQIIYTPSKEWIQDTSRQFPITIDPTVTFFKENGYFVDGVVYQVAPSTNYKGSTGIILGMPYTGIYYFKCNFFPNEDTAILSSKLYVTASSFWDNTRLDVRRVTSSWNPDTLTYNNRPGNESNLLDYAYVQKTTALDITPYAQEYSMKKVNDGLMISADSSGQCNLNTSYSSTEAPYIVTEYSALAGDYSDYSCHTVSAGRAGTVTVNDFTGRMQFEAEDLAIPGNRMPVSIKRVRTAEGVTDDVGFGKFFYTNYHQKLEFNGSGQYKFRTEKGGYLYFKEGFSGPDELNAGYKLISQTRNPYEYSKITIENPDGHMLYFNGNGNLIKIKDKQQAETSSIDITYVSGNRIHQITDGAGGRYQFVYNGTTISEIRYLGKTGTAVIQKVSYSNNVNGSVSYFTAMYPDGKTSNYTLQYDVFLSSIKNSDGSGIGVSMIDFPTYPTKYLAKVNKLTEYGRGGTVGDTLTFTYGTMQTTIADANGNKEIYQFDRNGKATGIRNQDGEAVFASYGGEQGQLLGFSKIRSTKIGENLVSYFNYGSMNVGYLTHDSSIPVLAGKQYQELYTSYDREAKASATVSKTFQAGDTLTFGGWLKGNFQGAGTGTLSDRGVSIQIAVYKQNGVLGDTYEVQPNPYVTDWQYILEEITLEYPVSKLVMTLQMNKQAHHVFISNLECKLEGKAEGTTSPVPSPSPTTSPTPTPVMDSYENILREVDERGAVTEYTYDAAGNQLSRRKTADGKELYSSTKYDSNKNMIQMEQDTSGKFDGYYYTNKNQLSYQCHLIAGEETLDDSTRSLNNTKVTAYQYNESGEVTNSSFYDYKGNYIYNEKPSSVNYSEDDSGMHISTKNNLYDITYNAFGDITKIGANSKNLVSYEYKSNSNRIPTKVTYGNGQAISYQYNNKNQLTSDGQGTYTYDEQGELASVTDSVNQTKTEYKENKTSVYNQENTLLYQYENKGDSQSFEKNEMKVTVAKQAEDSKNGIYEQSLSYNGRLEATAKTVTDKLGRLYQNEIKRWDHKNLLKKTYSYKDLTGNRTTEQVSGISYAIGTSTPENETYTYDEYGNITSIQDKNGIRKYTYDLMGQLIREDDPVQNVSIFYTYSEGNLTSTGYYSYNTTTERGTYFGSNSNTYGNGDWKDLLTSYSGYSITYDSIGNPLTYLGRTLTWEKGRQLKSNVKNGITTSYTYGVDGLRTRKKVGSTTHDYTYVNGQLLAYEEGSNKMMFSYDEAGNPFGLRYNGAEYYYQTNLQGDVIGIIDEIGTKVVSYAYDAWGKLISVGGEQADGIGKLNPLRYRGYVYDTDTGWYYLQSRYYDTSTGRFINADDPSILLLQVEIYWVLIFLLIVIIILLI